MGRIKKYRSLTIFAENARRHKKATAGSVLLDFRFLFWQKLSKNQKYIVTNQLKAFSIVETLAALVLITLAFGAGAMIYLNVLSTSNIAVKEKANLILEEVYQKTILTERYVSEELIERQFKVEKKIQPYRNNSKVYLLQLKAFDNKDKLIATHRTLISLKPNKEEK